MNKFLLSAGAIILGIGLAAAGVFTLKMPGARAVETAPAPAPACVFPYETGMSPVKSIFCASPTQCFVCRDRIGGDTVCSQFNGWQKCVLGTAVVRSRKGVTEVK